MSSKTSLILCALAALASAACSSDEPRSQESDLFEAAYQEKDDPKADHNGCSGVRVPDQTGFEKRVALTFDDGPNPETTRKILSILRKHDVPAAFFINGQRVSSPEAEALVAEIQADPMLILANHTQNHEDMKTLSRDKAALQIDKTNAAIVAAGGVPAWFRFPFGSSTCETMKMVEERGMISTGWHVDSADWCFARDGGVCKKSTFKFVPDDMRSDMVAFTMSQARARKGGILLFHDIHANTANNIEAIIVKLKDEGFTFVAIDDSKVFPALNGITPKFIGDSCSTDDECRFPGGFCLPSDEVLGGYCTVGCSGSCPDRAGFGITRCVDAPDESGATTSLCLIECGTGCREGLECRQLDSTKGARSVCWR